MKHLWFPLGLVVAGVVGGCLAGSEPTSTETASTEPTYTETSVHLNADGTQTVTHGTITLSQELAQNAAREAMRGDLHDGLGTAVEAITDDTACAFTSLWLYDQASYTGNRICFYGAGIADLGGYNSCIRVGRGYDCTPWSSAAQSYLAGVDSGYFGSTPPACTSTCSFKPWGEGATSGCATEYLDLDGACGCASGQTGCSGTCRSTSTDPNNCGTCGNVCPSNLPTCSGGVCGCPSGETQCGSTCINTSTGTDPNNCGACGVVCGSGTACCLTNGAPSCQDQDEPWCCGPYGVNCGHEYETSVGVSQCGTGASPQVTCANPATGQCMVSAGYSKCP